MAIGTNVNVLWFIVEESENVSAMLDTIPNRYMSLRSGYDMKMFLPTVTRHYIRSVKTRINFWNQMTKTRQQQYPNMNSTNLKLWSPNNSGMFSRNNSENQ